MATRFVKRLLSLVAVPLLACSDSGVAPDGLRLDMTLSQTHLAQADSVILSLRLTNLSARPVRVTAPANYGFCSHAFEVADDKDREVFVNSALCAAMSLVYWPPIDLAPGMSVSIEDQWLPSSSFVGGQVVGPGKYTLIGRVWRGDVAKGDGDAVRSVPAEITILP